MLSLEKLIAIIAPHQCLVCGAEGSLLCTWCLPDALLPVPSRCYKCQKQTKDSQTCPVCRRTSKLSHVWVGTSYKEVAKQLVRELKYHHKRAAATQMVQHLADILPYLPPEVIIMPVPTANSRLRERGYDQAVLIARALARYRHMAYMPLLMRRGQSKQVGANRKIRLQQLQDAFWLRKPEIVKGKSVLLVDDVLTTGTTLEEAARVLKKAGAKTVNATVFAQAL